MRGSGLGKTSETQAASRISACLTDISAWMSAHHLKLNLGTRGSTGEYSREAVTGLTLQCGLTHASTLCGILQIMSPKDRRIYVFDSTNPHGFGDGRYLGLYSKLVVKLLPGQWIILKNKDLPQQIGGVDCVHVDDIPHIRRWWCLILLENFSIKRPFAHFASNVLPDNIDAAFTTRQELPGCVADLQEAVAWVKENMGLFTERLQLNLPSKFMPRLVMKAMNITLKVLSNPHGGCGGRHPCIS
ncbi:hypothetical protein DPEC_G00040650 [Dallia pectoralis]|uniref:Uncharacterized protein n=1 Tax=Dallia pectoralis TaxID=75939 RepID=A0ACC2HF16_DALPE|nr:hypothetical protein DPEC_G00040650 [Dallia pectoralis]